MAEFKNRRRAVKKERQLSRRVQTVVRETKKKRYADARDEDLKIVNEGKQLADDLEALHNVRSSKGTLKREEKELKREKKAEVPEDSDYDFSEFN
jgi:hypothetical protein